jgi:hypothetical protein
LPQKTQGHGIGKSRAKFARRTTSQLAKASGVLIGARTLIDTSFHADHLNTARPSLSMNDEVDLAADGLERALSDELSKLTVQMEIASGENQTQLAKLHVTVQDFLEKLQQERLETIPTNTQVVASPTWRADCEASRPNENDVVIMSSREIFVSEGGNGVHIPVLRIGSMKGTVEVTYTTELETRAMAAQEASDFQSVSGTLVFAPGVTFQEIDVPITNDSIWEPIEHFNVRLLEVVSGPCELYPKKGGTGHGTECTVFIVDDDTYPKALKKETTRGGVLSTCCLHPLSLTHPTPFRCRPVYGIH